MMRKLITMSEALESPLYFAGLIGSPPGLPGACC
jgi:hypothetical protein